MIKCFKHIRKLQIQENKMFSKIVMLAFLIFLFGCGKQPKNIQDVLDVSEEPNHQLVFENDLFQILDIQFMPGDTSRFHKHSRATLYTSLGWYGSAWQYPGSDWESSSEQWLAGGVEFDNSYLKETLVHRVTNIGRKTSRIIAIVHKGVGNGQLTETDEYELANSWFRVQRFTVSPKDTLSAIALPSTQVLIFPNEGHLVRLEEKSNIAFSEKWGLLKPEDRLVNQSPQPVVAIAIEVLD